MKERLLRAFVTEVWDKGNVEAASDYIAPAYTIHHDPGDPWEGMTLDVEAFKDRVRKSREPVPDQRFTIQELFEGESRVAITWKWQGTHWGEIAGFPPTGQQIQMSGATVYYFEDGRISGHWQIADRLAVFRQLQQASVGHSGR